MRKLLGAAAPALFLLATITPLFAQEAAPVPAAKTPLVEKEQVLGSLGDGKNIRSVSISTDSNHVAILAQKGDKYVVTVDGAPGKEHEFILARSVTFSPNAKRSAYVVQQGDKMFAVIDGQEGKPYHEIATSYIS